MSTSMLDTIIMALPKTIQQTIKKLGYLLPDRQFIYLSYFVKFGRFPRLKNPVYYTEKIQWLKLHQTESIYSQLADKHAVRAYIKEKIGEHVLIPQYWHGENPEDIPFDTLPDAFVIKCNHGSGYNIFVQNKNEIDQVAIKKKLHDWLAIDFRKIWRELHYKHIKKMIVIEELLSEDGKLISLDYKIYCFNGIPTYVVVNTDRFGEHKVNILNIDRQEQPFGFDWPKSVVSPKKPETLSQMIDYANVLSSGFPLMRVDFYQVNGKVYFGEITLTPSAGYGKFTPIHKVVDKLFGDLLVLPKKI